MTHREWLEHAKLGFNIGGRKENTLVWIANDFTYRPAHGDTGLRLEQKHLRGQVFPSLYRALKRDVLTINHRLLGHVPQAGTDTARWETTMRALCERRQWLRLFIQHGGLSTVIGERDMAEARVRWVSNSKLREAQAQSDAERIAAIGADIRRGAYAIQSERLVKDVMNVVREDATSQALAPAAPQSPDMLSRQENTALDRALDSRS